MSAEFFVLLAFLIFMGILGYAGVHKTILRGLDARGERIARELNEAARLREEAARLLAEFEGKRAAATRDAEQIVADARAEAEVMRQEAQARLEEMIARRTRQAEAKIAMAERDATAEVKSAAADAAVRAAGVILGRQGSSDAAMAEAIGEVTAKLN